jgi:type II secretion system protein L
MKPVQIIMPPTSANAAWRTLSAMSAARGPSRILLAPGSLVLAREVDHVGRTEAQARSATLAALAPELAMPADACVCALTPARGDKRMAFVISREALDRLTSDARANGFAPDAVVPNFALLPAPEGEDAVVAQGPEAIVRLRDGGFSCQPDLLPLLLGARLQRHVDFDEAARTCVASGRHVALPNLLQTAPSSPAPGSRRMPALAIASLAAALAIFAALPWIDAYRLNSATAALRRETEQVARAALPNAQRIVNPIAQLREARMPAALAAGGLDHAAILLEGLARAPGVSVTRLDVTDGQVRAHVDVASTSLLQPLRDHVAASGLQLVETPGISQPNSIPVDLELAPTP